MPPAGGHAMLGGVLLDLLAPPRCLACGRRGALPWCETCVAATRRLRLPAVWRGGVTAAYRYRGVVADAVLAAKLGGAHGAWGPLGRVLAGHVGQACPDVDVVVPVPTEPGRRRRRGVDHARRLALPVAARLRVPLRPALEARPGSPDQGRARHHRTTLPVGTFAATGRVPGARVLLVDDVLTTGATARAAAGALLEAGAARVAVAVLARAA